MGSLEGLDCLRRHRDHFQIVWGLVNTQTAAMPTTTSPTSRRLTPAQHAALTSLQMQAKFANELLQLLLRQRSEPIAPTDARKQRRELRRQLREAQLVMARHRPECDAIIRRAAAAGISIPTLTPTMLANLLLDPGYGSL